MLHTRGLHWVRAPAGPTGPNASLTGANGFTTNIILAPLPWGDIPIFQVLFVYLFNKLKSFHRRLWERVVLIRNLAGAGGSGYKKTVPHRALLHTTRNSTIIGRISPNLLFSSVLILWRSNQTRLIVKPCLWQHFSDNDITLFLACFPSYSTVGIPAYKIRV